MGKDKTEEKPAAAAPAKGGAAPAKGGAAPAKGGAAPAKGAAAPAADAAAAPAVAAPAVKGAGAAKKAAKPAAPVKKKAKAPPKKLYAVQGTKIVRTKTECPKCGTGYFMAVHYNRRTCGKCSYTQFTDKDGNVRGFGGAPMGGPSGAIRQSRRLGRTQQGGGGGPGPAGEE